MPSTSYIRLLILFNCWIILIGTFQQIRAQDTLHEKWSEGFSIGPTYEYRQVKLLPGHQSNKDEDYCLNSQTPKAGIQLKYILDFRIKKTNYYFSTGLGYENKGYSSTKADTVWQEIYLREQIFPGNIPKEVYYPTPAAVTSQVDNRFHTIGLQLGLSYKKQFHKVLFIGSAGIIGDVTGMHAEVKHYRYLDSKHPYMTGDDVEHDYYLGNLNLYCGIGISVRLKQNLSLSFHPTYIQGLFFVKDENLDSRDYAFRLYSITFPLSIIYSY
jgi:hypothetical protein